jgi:penicillin-binding protein 1A
VKSPFHRTGQDNNPFRELYSKPSTGKKRNSFFGGIARFVMLILIACLAGLTGIATQGYLYFTHNLPGIEKLKNYSPPTVTEFYSDKNELIGEFATERRFVVPLENVPKTLQNAFVAAEDKNFWSHSGVDKEAIIRAVKQNLTKGGIASGASTITQQVAKTFLLTPERTFVRKIKEAILAVQIERSLSKEQILHLYLNQIYLGSSAYGVQAAAQSYFDKQVTDLTIAECAMIGGLAKAPSKDSPKINSERALGRRGYVLKRMLEDGYISQAEYDSSNIEEPRLVTRQNPHSKVSADFVEQVRRYVDKKYGTDALYKEGLKVYTTVDLEMTKAAHQAIDAGLRELDKRQGYRGPIKTLTVKEVMEYLKQQTDAMEEPLKFGQIVEGIVTQIDSENIYVRMGSYIRGGIKKEYVGQIKIDPSPKWWVRIPSVKPEWRTRNFSPGDLPFQVGDLIQVRIADPNLKRRELYAKKFAKTDPELKNYKEYSEEMTPQFPLEAEQQPLLQSALMMRENRTGYVRALVGGSGAAESKYNRATQARRQAGSSFKPVIYAAALNKGFTCSDIIIDSPLALNIPGTGEVWRPKNYRGGFQGPVTFRDAIVHSRNIPTIKILQQIGLEQAKAYARKLGYTSPLVDNLTLALGSTGVSLEEQVNAYAVFANKGYFVPGVYVRRIVDRKGKILEERDSPIMLDDPMPKDQPQIQRVAHRVPSGIQTDGDIPDRGAALVRRAIDEGTAYIMTSLLQGVIQDGTATVLKKIVGRPDIAGKTGTTNEAMDAWFVGFSPDYSCGVWVGFDEEIPIGDAETGGKAAAPIWGYFMREVLRDKPVKEFATPQSVEFRKVDPRTGLMTSSPGGLMEVFKTGSGPAEGDSKFIKGSRWDYSGSDLDQF